jgi:hypothetical protein
MHAWHADDLLGVLGSVLVFASFWMKSSIPLRTMALASNVVFIAYATVAWLLPILVLHVALLPLNAARLWELWHVPAWPGRKPGLPEHAGQAARTRLPPERSSEAL